MEKSGQPHDLVAFTRESYPVQIGQEAVWDRRWTGGFWRIETSLGD